MKVIVAIGTRPEAIKMAPVVRELGRYPDIRSIVCVTGQHRQMLDQVLGLFDITPDIDFDVMRPDQTLNQLMSRIVNAADDVLVREQPDLVLVHGDTTTAMAVGLAAFHRGVAVGHVEAGLRTHDMQRPFPEEFNRRAIDLVATYHFAPTERARDNLLAENVDPVRLHVTGNTVVDALLMIRRRLETDDAGRARLRSAFPFLGDTRPMVLITGHRRESFGAGFENICAALKRLSQRYDYNFVYPVHLNPNVAAPVRRLLSGQANIFLPPPLDYGAFVAMLHQARFVITDSGGVQEEAVSLGKQVLVMREVTERPEGVAAGLAHLVGVDADRIVAAFGRLAARHGDDAGRNRQIYGDGRAAERIVNIISGRSGAINRRQMEMSDAD